MVAGTALLLGGLVAVVLGKVKLVVIAVVTLVIVVQELRRPRAA